MGLFMNPRFTCNHLSHNNISFSPFPFFFSFLLMLPPSEAFAFLFFGSTSVQFQLVSYLLLLLLLLDVSGVCRHQMSLQSCWPVLARWSQQSLDKHRHETQPLQKIGSVRVCLCVCVLQEFPEENYCWNNRSLTAFQNTRWCSYSFSVADGNWSVCQDFSANVEQLLQ